MNSKIDIDRFICTIMGFAPISKDAKYLIQEALRKQNLEYRDGEIVELNTDNTKDSSK